MVKKNKINNNAHFYNYIYKYKNIHHSNIIKIFSNGYKTRIFSKNNILYLHYFNNNIIYKEIINEYNMRIHNKNNKYEHSFILNKNIKY